MTSSTAYKVALAKAKEDLKASIAELGEIELRQRALEQRIVELRQTVAALSKLCGEEFLEEDALGLTDAVRMAFKSMGNTPMAIHDVRGRIESLGFDTSRYGNVMASIHTVVRRLVEKQELTETGTIGNKPAFAWRNAVAHRIG